MALSAAANVLMPPPLESNENVHKKMLALIVMPQSTLQVKQSVKMGYN